MYKLKNIPNALRLISAWVNWLSFPDENSHSGIKKMPVNPHTGQCAKSNDSSTWGTFDEALSHVDRYNGLGFMFSGSGHFGVDIDDCREEIEDFMNGGTDNIIYEFTETLKSYTEISTSGNGVHIICKGKLPDGKRRSGKVEMYDQGRFFIMTGNTIGKYTEISDGTESIIPLHRKYLGGDSGTSFSQDQSGVSYSAQSSQHNFSGKLSPQEIIAKAMTSRNGSKFAALYSGDINGYPSKSEADLAFCNMLAFWTGGDIEVMDTIYRDSGLYRDKWDRNQCGSTYGRQTLARAVSDCNQFYEPGKAEGGYSISISGGSDDNETEQSVKIRMHTFDDTGNAMRMYDLCSEYLRYSYTDKRWLYYENGTWKYDVKGIVYKAADKVLEFLEKEMKLWAEHEGGKFYDDFMKHRKRSRSNVAKKAMIKELEHLVSINHDEMDTHKTLVNSVNGVLNLDDGSISPHNNVLYMTKMLGTSMPVTPKKPVLWLKFLDDIFSGDKALIQYVQKALGYSLSGITREQCVFFLYGTGRNGKSTFLEVVRDILGEYATNIQPESIMMKAVSSTANTDIARLKGARLVTSVEPNEGMRLNEGLLKQLTGDDVVTARKLYGDEFEYRPEFKLWMATNHKPTIRGTDIGIWRRIHLIPFTVTIPEDKIDKNLGEKLNEELPDILAWMMEGYRLWKSEGLNKPKVILDAIKEYRNEMDVISAFLDSDRVMEGGEIKASQLYAIYVKWASEGNEYKVSQRKFGSELTSRYNFQKVHKTDGTYYIGISAPGFSIGGVVVNESVS